MSVNKDLDIIFYLEYFAENKPLKTALINCSSGLEGLILDEINFNTLLRIVNKLAFKILHALNHNSFNKRIVVLTKSRQFYFITLLAIIKIRSTIVPFDANVSTQLKNELFTVLKPDLIISDYEQEQDNYNQLFIDKHDMTTEVFIERNILRNKIKGYQEKDYIFCIIFTSGTTGRSKGVKMKYLSLLNYLDFAKKTYPSGGDLGSIAYTSINYDFIFTNLLLPLINGEAVVTLEEKTFNSALKYLVDKFGTFSFLKLSPSYAYACCHLGNQQQNWLNTKAIIFGGEILEKSLVEKIRCYTPKECRIFNEYGPAEATVGCIVCELSEDLSNYDENLPIGQPIPNCNIMIMRHPDNTSRSMEEGELYLSGLCLADGYINDEDTKVKFQQFNNTVFYKTNDSVSYDKSGSLICLGRIGNEIKINNIRINLADLQQILNKNLQFTQLYLSSFKDENYFNNLLVAYSGELNNYQVEDFIVQNVTPEIKLIKVIKYNFLPINSNGKVNQIQIIKDLKSQTFDPIHLHNSPIDELLNIWRKTLKKDDLSSSDDFFENGGDSISAIQLVSAMKKLGYHLSLIDIFDNPTIDAICSVIKKSTKTH